MALNVDEWIERLGPDRRRRVEERAAELIAEEMTLRELRKARRLTQAKVAAELGITQDGVSRLEQRSDLPAIPARGFHTAGAARIVPDWPKPGSCGVGLPSGRCRIGRLATLFP